MKKILLSLIILSIILTMLTGAVNVSSNEDITVTLDGEVLTFDVEPQIINDRTMVPLRKIFEEIGALVKWDDETQTVYAKKSSKTLALQIGSAEMEIDNGKTDSEGNAITETVELDSPATIVDNRTLVPVRAISEFFGYGVDWSDDTYTVSITSPAEDESWKDNVGEINLSDMTFTGEGIEINGNVVKITKGGDYTVSGSLENGNITVRTDEKVKLRLNGASISSSDDPCIFIVKADKAYITLNDGTENTLNYSGEKGAILTKTKLEIKGAGTLDINSDVSHGIKASDNLEIENGTFNISAKNDGINVNDTFKMTGGTLNITAEGDGIASDSIVTIEGGTINIETTGEPIESEETETQNQWRFGPMESASVDFASSTKGIKAEWMINITGGEINVNSADHAIHCADEIEITGGNLNIASKYAKGISGHGNVTVDGSDTVIDVTKSTEGLESKETVTVNDGTIKIVSSDDGINATGGQSGEMMFGGGPNMGERPENSDGTMPERQDMPQGDMQMRGGRGGRMRMDQQQDGQMPQMPPMDGEFSPENMPQFDENFRPENMPEFDSENMPDFGGMFGMEKDGLPDSLIINGGNLEIISGDDCLDSNGNIVLNGGVINAVKENGTFTGFNSILDYEGKITINEGVTFILACAGSQGSVSIPQNNITVYFENTHSKGEAITVKDESGNIVLTYTPSGSYSAALITSPDLKTNGTYTVSAGSETNTVTLSEQNTTIGTRKNTGFGGGRMGR